MKNILQITLITLFALSTAFTATATDSKKVYNGYVVLANGDTLKGKIQMLSPTLNEVKVKFIASNGKQQVFKSKEVLAYSFVVPTNRNKVAGSQTITYVKKNVEQSPVPFGSKEVLVERQVKGQINLYNHYVETRAGQYAYNHFFLLEKDGEIVTVNRENFKKAVKNAVADYPELKVKVGKKGYGYKYMAKIITEYNNYNTPKNGQFLGMK